MLGNDAKDEGDQAIGFLKALDKSRYGEFVVEYLNRIGFGSIWTPRNVEEVYNLANTRLQVKRSSKTEGAIMGPLTIHPNSIKIRIKIIKRKARATRRMMRSQ